MNVWRRLGVIAYWAIWPALFVYLRLGKRTRVLVTSGEQVLLVRGWLSDGKWGLPGGGLRRGENPAVGVMRETVEEAGLHLDAIMLRPLGSEACRDNGITFYCHFFAVELDHTPAVRPHHEIIAAQWFPRTELVALPLKPDARRALELLQG